MSLWRRIREEAAGAWRSVGYDLGRRPLPPAPAGDPDVTSTGMNTFGGSMVDMPSPLGGADAAPPRRFVAVTVFCLLALLGAGGSYFVATSIFSTPRGVVQERGTPPRAAADVVQAGEPAGVQTGMGTRTGGATRPSPADRPAGDVSSATGVAGTAGASGVGGAGGPGVSGGSGASGGAGVSGRAGRTGGAAADPAPATSRHPRPATVAPEKTRVAEQPCDCVTPPVPTPTAPSASPAVSPSPQPSGNTDSSPDPGVSARPSASASPATDDEITDDRDGHRRRH
ncbi:hypothetical protein [Actinoplanes sp. NPDC023714]|uniref:hypothetical protein n=1 Tax=Actinoplanes sp. NPDC023714 TaxID=3154322 RepID=UPI0033F597BF